MADDAPLRILHVVGRLNPGGVETYLVHLLRNRNPHLLAVDILVHAKDPGALEAEAGRLGARILRCPAPQRPVRYAQRFLRLVASGGPYTAVHSHVHHYSGFVLFLAAIAGVRVRVAHSHSDTSRLEVGATLPRRAYLRLMRALIRQFATHSLAVSQRAAEALYGEDSLTPSIFLPCAIDLAPYASPVDSPAVRHELGLRTEHFVVGHVGRFDPAKNHRFIVDVAVHLQPLVSDARFLLIGDGPLEEEVRSHAAASGVSERFIFCGRRDDVARLLLGAVDVILHPSLWEGLPVSLLEAQAAGLPILASENIDRAVDVVPGLIHWLPLEAGPRTWALQLAALSANRTVAQQTRVHALATLKRSRFNIGNNIEQLMAIYAN